MHRPKLARAALPSFAAAFALATLFACQPTRPADETLSGESDALDPGVDPDARLGPALPDATAPALLFPPPASGRTARPPLPADLQSAAIADPNTPVSVVKPELDAERHFSFSGPALVLRFDRPIVAAAKATAEKPVKAAKGTLTLSPAARGKAQWTDDRTLQFTADRPFKPDTTYTVTVAGIAATDGAAFAPWTASFEAEPRVTVAGKVLDYIPKLGAAKPVALTPWSGASTSPTPTLAVVFDQTVDLELAAKLVTLHDDEDKPVAIELSHPDEDRFDGVDVARDFVVVVRPAAPLPRGSSFDLRVTAQRPGPKDSPQTVNFSVAPLLEWSSVDCGYGYDDNACDWDDRKKLLTTSGDELVVSFNNPIDRTDAELQTRVSVTPTVANLRVSNADWYSDEGRVVLHGDFEPSKRYRVQLRDLVDKHGSSLASYEFTVQMKPRAASATMPEGLLALDARTTAAFPLTSRNVAAAQIRLWAVDAAPGQELAAWGAARQQVLEDKLPMDAPDVTVRVVPPATRDALVTTPVDLTPHVKPGTAYLASVIVETTAYGADLEQFPEWSDASKPPLALLTPGDANTLTLHARQAAGGTVVRVARLASGAGVGGAELWHDGALVGTTDAQGVAKLPLDLASRGVLQARFGDGRATLPLGTGSGASELTPELSTGTAPLDSDVRALIHTDRGIYRPGATVGLKAVVRARQGGEVTPLMAMPVRLRVLSPTDREVFSHTGFTDDLGRVAVSWAVPADAKIGRHRVEVGPLLRDDVVLASAVIQVAEFEPPKFKVDVDSSSSERAGAVRVRSVVQGRYLFGAPLAGGRTYWTLRREPAPLPAGPLTAAGLRFRAERWWDEMGGDDDAWTRGGEGTLAGDGSLVLDEAVELPSAKGGSGGPQRFTLEAEVYDESNRAITGRGQTVVHPAERYAGLKVAQPWGDVGAPVTVELGAIDQAGASVVGRTIAARLDRLEWSYVRTRGPGGGLDYTWKVEREPADRCTATTAVGPVTCTLTPPRDGSYEIVAEIDGRDGGATDYWAWGRTGESSVRVPDRGHRIEPALDRASYRAGDVAKLLVTSPYPAATAILTVEQGAKLRHEARAITGPSTVFEVPLAAGDAPWVHATVTLLPTRAASDGAGFDEATIADWKFGAVRIPLDLGDVQLQVAVDSDRAAYEPGGPAKVTVKVTDASGAPVSDADVGLAVVDEGVLRLTNYRAPDPIAALYPGSPLDYLLADDRSGLAALLQHGHTAGDGPGDGASTIAQTRRNFVETALWLPTLRTDANGVVVADFTLPDNLTEFRMTAVAIDRRGRGGSGVDAFTVRKPLMISPVVPRFVALGDTLDVAAMVHNNREQPAELEVTLAGATKTVRVGPGERARVATPFAPTAAGPATLRFAIAEAGVERDAAEVTIPVKVPGLAEHPVLLGRFSGQQLVKLDVPSDVQARPGEEFIEVVIGEHLQPDLGERLLFLLGYPHGCVEQTTSSTLPLLAARELLPQLGITAMPATELDAKIRAGLTRLASMRTDSGGLAYWPGGTEPNVFGTAYAARAVVAAKAAGIAPPAGLLEGMLTYLGEQVTSSSTPVEVRAAIAQTLAEQGALPASTHDALYDTRDEQGPFGLASLAIALARQGGEQTRVDALLDALDARLADDGAIVAGKEPTHQYSYYGSSTRSQAQALVALTRLRPNSPKIEPLAQQLQGSAGRSSYTTQATAYALMALAERMQAVPAKGAEVEVALDGAVLAAHERLPGGAVVVRVPLAEVRGVDKLLRLRAGGERSVAFRVSANWQRPAAAVGGLAGTSGSAGLHVYRVLTDPAGKPVDPRALPAGTVLRVALLVRMPEDGDYEHHYLALSDPLPAGMEAIQPDLWTVASAPQITDEHPFADKLRYSSSEASFVEMRDDRVDLYFDHVWGETAAATYLVRTTTPGQFSVAPTVAELMYTPDSLAYGEGGELQIQ